MINKILNTTRKAGRYTMTLTMDNGDFVMDGGKWGRHTLSMAHTTDARLIAHWDGYTKASGWREIMTQDEMRARWEASAKGADPFNAMTGSPASWKRHLKGRS